MNYIGYKIIINAAKLFSFHSTFYTLKVPCMYLPNPPHQIRPRYVYLFLNQFASSRASICTSEEEGLFIACVAGVESGRGLGGREKGGRQ